MRLCIQRVKKAEVVIDGEVFSSISQGLLAFLGIHKDDTKEMIPFLADKLAHLRMFPDQQEKMNLSLIDTQNEALIVSQFTLYGDLMTGRRPSFTESAAFKTAQPLYDFFVNELKSRVPSVKTGLFGAKMEVLLINDGPITFLLEAPSKHGEQSW